MRRPLCSSHGAVLSPVVHATKSGVSILSTSKIGDTAMYAGRFSSGVLPLNDGFSFAVSTRRHSGL